MANNLNLKSIDEAKFVDHNAEFFRFYDGHKTFCDEIAGIKERIIIRNGEESKMFITPDKFSFGIKKLNSFVIDSLQYIPDPDDGRNLEDAINELEQRFLDDSEYESLLLLKNRSLNQEIDLQQRYFKYMLECFRFGSLFVQYLQSSLMISTRNIHKKIGYYNDTGIFQNLARYRDEVSDALANFEIKYMLTTVKHIIGYYNTYKILMIKEDADIIERIVPDLVNYCLDPSIFILSYKQHKNLSLSPAEYKDLRKQTFLIKRLLSKIYYITNKSLSDKKILPKVDKRVSVDRSLI